MSHNRRGVEGDGPGFLRQINVGAYGADSDAGIFRECVLYHDLEQDEAGLPPSEPLPGGDTDVPYFLVGDDAFALKSWMMKPHSKREFTAVQRIFNYRLYNPNTPPPHTHTHQPPPTPPSHPCRSACGYYL